MPRRRTVALWLSGVAAASLLHVTGPARAEETPAACTDPTVPLDPSCVVTGSLSNFTRQLCDYQWVEDPCAGVAPGAPQYATDDDPNPSAPFALRVGALHNHSGYSDGDPETIPADYYRAGREGHNTADAGGDTGVKLDFMFGSEHSDNERIPLTTAAVCVESFDAEAFLSCNRALDSNDHYWKWAATLRQAMEGTEYSPSAGYYGFTGARGFEWTNDYYNHMNVFFSQNVVNVKTDGSYASMDVMWDWLRKPVDQGGGADGLVTFNHPGGDPHLTPVDGGLPHTVLLQELKGGANWNDVAYVPDVDERVAGMEVNGGDDLSWFVKALSKGWHIGPVAAEDEHQREWATSTDGKTLMLTRGRSPRDYYFALRNHRTVAIRHDLVDGAPGTKAVVPTIHFYAGGRSINDKKAVPLGSTISSGTSHKLNVELAGVPAGSRVALVSDTTGGQAAPVQLGTVGATGAFKATRSVSRPAAGQNWYFVVVCSQASTNACGTDEVYSAVTAPIWLAAE